MESPVFYEKLIERLSISSKEGVIPRKDIPILLSRIKIDKITAKKIIEELEALGLVKRVNQRFIRIKK